MTGVLMLGAVVSNPQGQLGDGVGVVRTWSRHTRRHHVLIAHSLDILGPEPQNDVIAQN